jgi:hypothetical protein
MPRGDGLRSRRLPATADKALLHLATMNGWDEVEAEQHVVEAFDRWRRRTRRTWVTDVSCFRDYGIDLPTSRPAAPVADGFDDRSDARDAEPLALRASALTMSLVRAADRVGDHRPSFVAAAHASGVSSPAAAALISPPTIKIVKPSWIAVGHARPVEIFSHGTPIPKMISWPAM